MVRDATGEDFVLPKDSLESAQELALSLRVEVETLRLAEAMEGHNTGAKSWAMRELQEEVSWCLLTALRPCFLYYPAFFWEADDILYPGLHLLSIRSASMLVLDIYVKRCCCGRCARLREEVSALLRDPLFLFLPWF